MLVSLAEDVVRAVLEELLVGALLEVNSLLLELARLVLHVAWLADIILGDNLVQVHLEALTRAQHVTVPCKNHHVSRVNPVLIGWLLLHNALRGKAR